MAKDFLTPQMRNDNPQATGITGVLYFNFVFKKKQLALVL